MTRDKTLALMVVILLGCLLAAATFGQDKPATKPAAKTPTTKPAKPKIDHIKALLDDYDQGAERLRFFAAAGVDSELSAEEFKAAAGKKDSFVRTYDKWAATLVYDKDKNSKLNWSEAEAYRLGMRKTLLERFDKSGDGKLVGAERDAANALLARGGSRRPRIGGGPAAGGGQSNWRDRLREQRAKYDKDGDGELSREERTAMWQAMRDEGRQRELDRWDANKDGKIDKDERQAQRDQWREQAGQWRARMALSRYDKNKDGELDAEETAARDAARKKQQERTERWREQMAAQEKAFTEKWDADKDGEISAEERKAALDHYRKRWDERRKEMDTDGDGRASMTEMREYWKGVQKKYDADGDGELNDEERSKMIQEEYGEMGGMMGAWSGRGRGGRRRGRTVVTEVNRGSGEVKAKVVDEDKKE